MRILKNKSKTKISGTQLAKLVQTTLDDRKAENISLINLKNKADFADFMVIASGTSQRHVAALADHLKSTLKERGLTTLSIEGREACDWVLVDVGNVIVHLFKPEARTYYNLEKMWSVKTAPEPT